MKFTKDRILHKGEILAKKGEHQMIHPSSSSLQASHGSLLEKQRKHHPPGPPWSTAVQNTFRFSRKTLEVIGQVVHHKGTQYDIE